MYRDRSLTYPPTSLANLICQPHLPTSFANLTESGRLRARRILRHRGLTETVFLENRGASHRIGRAFAARLHEIGRIIDHGGEIALVGAAHIPELPILGVVPVVQTRTDVLGPKTAGPGLRGDPRIADAHGGEIRTGHRIGADHDALRR